MNPAQEDAHDGDNGSYRVTVRQLEAMIRLGEVRPESALNDKAASIKIPG